MKHELIGVEQTTNNKYLNLFKLTYRDQVYEMVSRHKFSELEVLKGVEAPCTAVGIFPYIRFEDTAKIVMIKEFRPAINGYVYSFPAGLIDEGELDFKAVNRELKEEVGGRVRDDKTTLSFCAYPNVGMSDECLLYVVAEVVLDQSPELQDHEDIELQLIELKDIPEFLQSHQTELTTSAWLGISLLCNKFKVDMFGDLSL